MNHKRADDGERYLSIGNYWKKLKNLTQTISHSNEWLAPFNFTSKKHKSRNSSLQSFSIAFRIAFRITDRPV